MSDDNDLAGTFTFSKAANPKVSFDKIFANEYVAYYYDSNLWIALVKNVNCDEKGIEINFWHPPGSQIALLGQREKMFVGYHIWMWYVKPDLQQHLLGERII